MNSTRASHKEHGLSASRAAPPSYLRFRQTQSHCRPPRSRRRYLEMTAFQALLVSRTLHSQKFCNLIYITGDSNKHRYVVASQSQPLRSKLRSIPAVRVVHITRSAMILEPMSEISQQAKARVRAIPLSTTPALTLIHTPSNNCYSHHPTRQLS